MRTASFVTSLIKMYNFFRHSNVLMSIPKCNLLTRNSKSKVLNFPRCGISSKMTYNAEKDFFFRPKNPKKKKKIISIKYNYMNMSKRSLIKKNKSCFIYNHDNSQSQVRTPVISLRDLDDPTALQWCTVFKQKLGFLGKIRK